MGARVATRHCISLQPTKAAAPLAQLPKFSGYSYSAFPLSQRAASYEKSFLPAASQQPTSL